MRSLLFLPSTRLERFEKAINSGADAVILDLEDGVDPGSRANARAALTDLASADFRNVGNRIYIRINTQRCPDGILDMAMALAWEHWPKGFMLPKVEHTSEIRQIQELAVAKSKPIDLIPVIESAIGLARAEHIAAECGEIGGLAFGAVDYVSETRGSLERDTLLGPRSRIVNAAAIAAAPAIDGPWLDLDDIDGLEEDCRHARSLGFAGKIAIHPKHVATINRMLRPSAAEVDWARRVIEASAHAGTGAFAFEGRMIDAPVLAQARRLLDQAGGNLRAGNGGHDG
ncbi:MAG: HpcH/HpaI aldolase/citrate lyase family protein [Geminicoccaceae bacterium]